MEPESLPPIRALLRHRDYPPRASLYGAAVSARGNARWTRELHQCVRTLVWSIDAPGQEGIRASNTDKGPEGA